MCFGVTQGWLTQRIVQEERCGKDGLKGVVGHRGWKLGGTGNAGVENHAVKCNFPPHARVRGGLGVRVR